MILPPMYIQIPCKKKFNLRFSKPYMLIKKLELMSITYIPSDIQIAQNINNSIAKDRMERIKICIIFLIYNKNILFDF